MKKTIQLLCSILFLFGCGAQSTNPIQKWKATNAYQPLPVLLVHGFNTNQTSWDYSTEKLKEITRFYKKFQDDPRPDVARIYFDRVDWGGEKVPDQDFFGTKIPASEEDPNGMYGDIDQYWPNNKPKEEIPFGSWRSFEHAAYILKNRIDKTLLDYQVSQVIVACHSGGGLVTRALFRDHPTYAGKVARYVTLGAPHHGAVMQWLIAPIAETVALSSKIVAGTYSMIRGILGGNFKEHYLNAKIKILKLAGPFKGLFYYETKKNVPGVPSSGIFYEYNPLYMAEWQKTETVPPMKMVFNYYPQDSIADVIFFTYSQKGGDLRYSKTKGWDNKHPDIEIRPQLQKGGSLIPHSPPLDLIMKNPETKDFSQILKSVDGVPAFDSWAKHYDSKSIYQKFFSDAPRVTWDGKVDLVLGSGESLVSLFNYSQAPQALEASLPWIAVSDNGLSAEIKVKVEDFYPASDTLSYGTGIEFKPVRVSVMKAFSNELKIPQDDQFVEEKVSYPNNDPDGIVCQTLIKPDPGFKSKYVFLKVRAVNNAGLEGFSPVYALTAYNAKEILELLLAIEERTAQVFYPGSLYGYTQHDTYDSYSVGNKTISLRRCVGKNRLASAAPDLLNGLLIKNYLRSPTAYATLGYFRNSFLGYQISEEMLDPGTGPRIEQTMLLEWNDAFSRIQNSQSIRECLDLWTSFVTKMKYVIVTLRTKFNYDFLAKIAAGSPLVMNEVLRAYYNSNVELLAAKDLDAETLNGAIRNALNASVISSEAFKSIASKLYPKDGTGIDKSEDGPYPLEGTRQISEGCDLHGDGCGIYLHHEITFNEIAKEAWGNGFVYKVDHTVRVTPYGFLKKHFCSFQISPLVNRDFDHPNYKLAIRLDQGVSYTYGNPPITPSRWADHGIQNASSKIEVFEKNVDEPFLIQTILKERNDLPMATEPWLVRDWGYSTNYVAYYLPDSGPALLARFYENPDRVGVIQDIQHSWGDLSPTIATSSIDIPEFEHFNE